MAKICTQMWRFRGNGVLAEQKVKLVDIKAAFYKGKKECWDRRREESIKRDNGKERKKEERW